MQKAARPGRKEIFPHDAAFRPGQSLPAQGKSSTETGKLCVPRGKPPRRGLGQLPEGDRPERMSRAQSFCRHETFIHGVFMILETSRVRLRPWKDSDLAPFRALNADPHVMRFFPAPLTPDESDALAASLQERMKRHVFGLWALELPGLAPFAGFIGLNVPAFDPSLVEIGWRMHKTFWGRGFATEGAALAMEAGFSLFHLEEICSFTAAINTPSERVMQRLGMEHRPEDDLDHPALTPGDRLSRHVLYRMSKKRWAVQRERFPFLQRMRVL